ncbi:tetratricopeptide repeat protein [Sphaerisporangium aureirubrum]|uniref:Tetratricopeptide repeat protein n=1 Tax=Sphaerisporangium aureirubrum TaxID=1544736 RepID=A0ABW1NMI5_9ACTN
MSAAEFTRAAREFHEGYAATADPDLLERAIELHRRAAEAAAPGDPLLPRYLSNLAVALSDRYDLTSALADLTDAIETAEAALRGTPEGAPERGTRLGNLGVFLSDRYDRLGDLDDLDTALDLLTEAAGEGDPWSADTARAHSNLSMLWLDRYERTRRPAELDASVLAAEAAVQATPSGSADLPGYLNNLGNAHRMRYERTAEDGVAGAGAQGRFAIEVADLLVAVEAYRRAVELCPAGSPYRPKFLTNLGNVLLDRWAVLQDGDDFTESVAVLTAAVEATPAGSPDLTGRLNNLAVTLQHGEPAHHPRAAGLFRTCCEHGLEAGVEGALMAAENWGRWALERRAFAEASEAYGFAWRAADRLYRTQAGRSYKQTWLLSFTGLSAGAALAAARSGDVPSAALALERGRAMLLAEALERDRAELDDLAAHRPDLSRRYLAAAEHVRSLDARGITY